MFVTWLDKIHLIKSFYYCAILHSPRAFSAKNQTSGWLIHHSVSMYFVWSMFLNKDDNLQKYTGVLFQWHFVSYVSFLLSFFLFSCSWRMYCLLKDGFKALRKQNIYLQNKKIDTRKWQIRETKRKNSINWWFLHQQPPLRIFLSLNENKIIDLSGLCWALQVSCCPDLSEEEDLLMIMILTFF